MTTRFHSDRHATPRRSSHRVVGVGSVLILLVCLAAPAPVFAFANQSTRKVVVQPGARGSANAVCPKGEHVAFGGVVGDFRSAFPQERVVPEGMRLTASNRWTTYGKGLSPAGHLTASAYCKHGRFGPRVASKSVSLARRTVGTAIATCPAGTVVLGGGYNSGAGPRNLGFLMRMERIDPRKWVVTMKNDGAKTTLTAYAYCSVGAVPKLVSRAVKLLRFGNASAGVSCPKGTSLVGGGFIASGTNGSFYFYSLTAPSSSRWVVKGLNVGNTGTLTARGYCR
jgi:hypothetical protein